MILVYIAIAIVGFAIAGDLADNNGQGIANIIRAIRGQEEK